MAAQSTALEAKKMEPKEFFSRFISPFVEKDELLENLMARMTEDEMKGKRGPIVLEGSTGLKEVSSVKKVIQAILNAKREKKILRVAGSAHSVSDAISHKDGVTLLLTGDLRKVEINDEKEEDGKKWLYCRIGAGCYLGVNRLDPFSDLQNSACYQLNQKGYGFPELGGIIHQSIGGFISTGSAGGSLKHSFADVIQEIEFVDGTGTPHTAKPGTEEWCAVGVSMGLFGVITHVSFRLPEMSLVEGSETNYKFTESLLGPDEEGNSKLKKSLETNEYLRVNWFPQKHVRRVQQWVAQQVPEGETIEYHSILACCAASGAAAIALTVCNLLLQCPNPTEFHYKIIGCALSLFVDLNYSKRFRDCWSKILPMDNEVPTQSIMKMAFTEIWVPLKECQNVMNKLQKLFEDQQACNNLATEIYGAKKSPFWLSMSYGDDNMVRVDPYWWAFNGGDKRKFFSYFWDALLGIQGSRLHWGKYLPFPGQHCGTIKFNLAYLKSVYTKMDDWLKMRETMDPDQVFVTDYWRGILEIPPPSH